MRKELLEEMRAREEKLHKQLARARLAAEKAAEQYARETAERDFKSSLQSMEMETVPSLRYYYGPVDMAPAFPLLSSFRSGRRRNRTASLPPGDKLQLSQ